MYIAHRLDIDVGEPLAGPAMRVLVVGRDRQFKRMARLLFERRGLSVRTGSDADATVELVRRHAADVVVVDVAGAVTTSLRAVGTLAALTVPVGIVLVTEGAAGVSDSIRVLPKWGPFEDLFTAAVKAHEAVRFHGGTTDAIL